MIAEQETAGRYIYAIVNDDGDAAWKADRGFPWTAEPIGFAGCPAYAISVGRAAAVVSNVPNRALRPERKNLATHYAVLKRLMSQSAVLPMGFGTIAESAEAIVRILQTHQEALLQQMRRVEGKFEMGLRVTWNVPNIFEHFVSTHPELCELRDKLFRPGADPSPQEKIELGRMFDRLLNAERSAHTRSVVGALSLGIPRDQGERGPRRARGDEPGLPGRPRRPGRVRAERFQRGEGVQRRVHLRHQRPVPAAQLRGPGFARGRGPQRERDMFLIDDILRAPVSGVLYVFREIQAAARAEAAKNADALRVQLAELYGMLESGRISSDQFDAKEKELLDRLDEICRVNEGEKDE